MDDDEFDVFKRLVAALEKIAECVIDDDEYGFVLKTASVDRQRGR